MSAPNPSPLITCPQCHGLLEDLVVLPCNHTVCRGRCLGARTSCRLGCPGPINHGMGLDTSFPLAPQPSSSVPLFRLRCGPRIPPAAPLFRGSDSLHRFAIVWDRPCEGGKDAGNWRLVAAASELYRPRIHTSTNIGNKTCSVSLTCRYSRSASASHQPAPDIRAR